MNYICKCKKINYLKNEYTYWEDRVVTTDELDIIDFLKKSNSFNYESILHIGIGNSFFAKNFSKENKIIGLTISKKEINKANDLNLNNYNVYLCDKYSKEFKQLLNNIKFDLIIDTNLKSYSCCIDAFNYFMENLLSKLNKNGTLITSKSGMNWFKKLKPKLSFNLKKFFYYKLKEVSGDKDNILTINELESFSKSYNLKMYFDEKLCYLKK